MQYISLRRNLDLMYETEVCCQLQMSLWLDKVCTMQRLYISCYREDTEVWWRWVEFMIDVSEV